MFMNGEKQQKQRFFVFILSVLINKISFFCSLRFVLSNVATSIANVRRNVIGNYDYFYKQSISLITFYWQLRLFLQIVYLFDHMI